MMTGIGLGFGGLGIVIMVLFWVGLIVLVVWLVRALFPSQQPTQKSSPDNQQNAQEILNRRYARGEITREQFELMKEDLQSSR